MTTPIKKSVNGQKVEVGRINTSGDRFISDKSEEDGHFVRKYNGFGINLDVFKKEVLNEVSTILIRYEREDGSIEMLKSRPEDWVRYGTEDKLGADEQIFYGKSQMNKVGTQAGPGQQTL